MKMRCPKCKEGIMVYSAQLIFTINPIPIIIKCNKCGFGTIEYKKLGYHVSR